MYPGVNSSKPIPTVRASGLICAVLLASGGLARFALAQTPSCGSADGCQSPPPFMPPAGETIWNPACQRAGGNFPINVPAAPAREQRPMGVVPERKWDPEKDSVAAFVEGVNHSDAAIEVLIGQGRILTLTEKADLAPRTQPQGGAPVQPVIAVGDPTVIDFNVLNTRQIRLIGRRMGVTDLTVMTPDRQTYTFEVRVVADLHILDAQLHCLFPDAVLKLTQVRDYVVVEGEARDAAQVARILETIRAYLASILTAQLQKITQQTLGAVPSGPAPLPGQAQPGAPVPDTGIPSIPLAALPDLASRLNIQGTAGTPRVVNLIRVPGSKQVLLKVRVAELNRTAMRQIGADFLFANKNGTIVGTQIGGSTIAANAQNGTFSGLAGAASTALSPVTTVFGIFSRGDFAFFLSALRNNNIMRILAEPNLVAMNGQAATFLAGGEFPVPVPQSGAGIGAAPTITVQFKEFGVKLGFLPTILDGDVIRLQVDPEVSSLNFAIGSVLVQGGTITPGLDTRKAHTVVEMREGQTLAMAGLLQLTMDGTTKRIPGLGDLPVLGPFFSNTTSDRIEKELLVLVTPYLVEPMNHDQVPPSPGDDVKTPTDLEFYLLNRIEGRVVDWRSTTQYMKDAPVLQALFRLDAQHVRGPHGYCE
jgi:pilus assembly protein CpaC